MRFRLFGGRVQVSQGQVSEQIMSVSEYAALQSLVAGSRDAGAKFAALLTIVYFVADEDSPYRNMGQQDCWTQAFAESGLSEPDIVRFRPELVKAADAYRRYNSNVYHRALIAIDKNMDSITRMLSETEPYISKREVSKNIGTEAEPEYVVRTTFETNSDQIAEYYKLLGGFMKSREEIYRQYIQKKDVAELRGDKVAGDLAKGRLLNPVLGKNFKR